MYKRSLKKRKKKRFFFWKAVLNIESEIHSSSKIHGLSKYLNIKSHPKFSLPLFETLYLNVTSQKVIDGISLSFFSCLFSFLHKLVVFFLNWVNCMKSANVRLLKKTKKNWPLLDVIGNHKKKDERWSLSGKLKAKSYAMDFLFLHRIWSSYKKCLWGQIIHKCLILYIWIVICW